MLTSQSRSITGDGSDSHHAHIKERTSPKVFNFVLYIAQFNTWSKTTSKIITIKRSLRIRCSWMHLSDCGFKLSKNLRWHQLFRFCDLLHTASSKQKVNFNTIFFIAIFWLACFWIVAFVNNAWFSHAEHSKRNFICLKPTHLKWTPL